ncbi:uncharacterized protein [Onthophagus taurus]|uniref:uncharacterized protein n=1 Tax=Onthophagus taurus TaxID=166361 RepID=UPI0039BE69FB
MSEVRITLDRQIELYGLISRAMTNLKKLGDANVTIGRIKSRLNLLNSNWAKFQQIHETVTGNRDEFQDHVYFKDDIYAECEEQYVNIQGDMFDLIDKLSAPSDNLANNSLNNTTRAINSHSPKLPRIDLPKFSGDYLQWKHFHDLFDSMVKSNSELSLVEKLHYLKMSVTEEPAQLLKNIAICEDNFARAWDILIDRYENKGILIDSHLSVLLSTRSIKHESSSELKRLISEIKENLGALEALDCPTNQWDNILFFLIVRRLDPETLKDWENLLGVRNPQQRLKS